MRRVPFGCSALSWTEYNSILGIFQGVESKLTPLEALT